MLKRNIGLMMICAAAVLSQRSSKARLSPVPWTKRSLAFAVPVNLDLNVATQVIHVNPAAAGADDDNPGSLEQPVRTIAAGVHLARYVNRDGLAARIVVAPGTYREQVSFTGDSLATAAPISLEVNGGTENGSVVLSGSDVWSDWARQDEITYTHAWPFDWGLAPYPNGWTGEVDLAPIVRRREMIFVDGSPLTQVLAAADLHENTFYVEPETSLVTLRLKAGQTLDHSVVEVASRPFLLKLQNTHNWLLRGIAFQHGNAAVQDGAVRITDSDNILLERCSFLWNNWIGFSVSSVKNLTMRGNLANYNGGSGFDGYLLSNLFLEGNETSFNNWRGAQGGFYGWSVAGAKFTGVHDGVIRSQIARSNSARGLWMDYDNTNIVIDQSTFENNANDGLFLEANTGPIQITGSSFSGNSRGSGILGANSQDVSISDCTLAGNAVAQLSISGDYTRTVQSSTSGISNQVHAERWALDRNTIQTTAMTQALLSTPYWAPFLSTYHGAQNRWRGVNSPPAFRAVFSVEGSALSFEEWRALVGSDLDSDLAFPMP
jgi:hypothetical protein